MEHTMAQALSNLWDILFGSCLISSKWGWQVGMGVFFLALPFVNR